jgi:hypothetical protein
MAVLASNEMLISCKRPLQPYDPQPHEERRQLRSFASSAFVGCISGLGSPLRLGLRVQQVRPDLFKRVEERIRLKCHGLIKHHLDRIPRRILRWSEVELAWLQ